MEVADDPSYILDLSGESQAGADHEAAPGAGSAAGRPWIGMQFECCRVYTRIYRNREGTAYEGYCPRCGRAVRLKVGPGGTDSRLFRAS
jgi:hypothetical protein